MIKIISWNVNGIRAIDRKGYFPTILQENADIFCLQETKCRPDQLSPSIINPTGYASFFSSHHEKKGYSGVATYYKKEGVISDDNLGHKELFGEGRLVMSDFGSFVLFNVYFPNGGSGPSRLEYKLRFYDAFLDYISKLKESGRSIIFTGDINTAHKEIDLARPKENVKNTGFLPIERDWIDRVVKAGFIDSFRLLHGEETGKYSYWDMKTFSRDRNVGWRIDYFFVSEDLKDKIKESNMLENIMGSDHCPIYVKLDLSL